MALLLLNNHDGDEKIKQIRILIIRRGIRQYFEDDHHNQ